MTTKPYADIRKALVDGIRNDPGKSDRLKYAAESWIAVIDGIEKHGEDEHNKSAFKAAHARFVATAENEPFPPELTPAEIAKAFGLGDTPQ
jgi:hypothetical protein